MSLETATQRKLEKWLDDNGFSDIHAKGEEGATLLHFAAVEGHTEVARMLLEAGADVNATDVDGTTPLHLATQNGYTEVANYLLSVGGPRVGIGPLWGWVRLQGLGLRHDPASFSKRCASSHFEAPYRGAKPAANRAA